MKEKHLHNLWQSKNLPLNHLYLTDGRKLEIIHFGYYNYSAPGPDFALGIIEIDGETISGSIEMHLKSSHWYEHGHQFDEAYEKVILHVVLEHDRDVLVHNAVLPTLELKSIVHPFYLLENQVSKSFINPFPCSGKTTSIKQLEIMKEWAIQKRLNALKVAAAESPYEDWTYLLARSFSRSNVTPEFLRLFLPGRNEFYGRNKRSLKSEAARELQFNALRKLHPESIIDLSNNQLNSRIKEMDCPPIGYDFWRSIRINAVFPYLYHRRYIAIDDVFSRLRKIAPENNYVIKECQNAGFEVKHAFDSQGLLFLNRYKCALKKCLTCAVGKEILKNDSKNSVLL